MAVTFRTTSQVVGTGTSPTLVEPSGAVAGDVLVAVAEAEVAAALTPPAGWTPLASVSSGSYTQRADYIVRGASSPNLTWTVTGSAFREVDIICLQSSGGTVRLDAKSADGSTGVSGHQPDSPAVTAVATSSLAVALAVNGSGPITPGDLTEPPGYTMRSLEDVFTDIGIATKSLNAPGVEDPAAWSGWNPAAADWWDGLTVTFTDVTTAAPAPKRLRGITYTQRML